jgi:hypothetical protein
MVGRWHFLDSTGLPRNRPVFPSGPPVRPISAYSCAVCLNVRKPLPAPVAISFLLPPPSACCTRSRCRGVRVASALIKLYFTLSRCDDARKVFDAVPTPDTVLWNTLLAGLSGSLTSHRSKRISPGR